MFQWGFQCEIFILYAVQLTPSTPLALQGAFHN